MSNAAESSVGMDPVLVEQDGPVAIITINRPKARNAINRAVSDGIATALQRADADDSIRAIVITGAGGNFCAGADLKEVMQGGQLFATEGPNAAWGLAGSTERTTSKPIIAAVEGNAFGGGFEVALAADIIVADPSARFALPEVKVGLIAGAGGVIRLCRLMPEKIALDLLLTGDPIDAPRALAHGVVSRISAPGEALAEAVTLAKHIATNAPYSVVATKRLARHLVDGEDRDLHEAWQRNRELFAEVAARQDAHEGASAFAERRAPQWTGR